MFDIGFDELLLVAIVAIIVVGPKDLPLALRTVGRWAAKVRRVSGHFRSGIESMIREAELEEMERKWREQNEAIMKAHPQAAPDVPPVASAEAGALKPDEPAPSSAPSPAPSPSLPPP